MAWGLEKKQARTKGVLAMESKAKLTEGQKIAAFVYPMALTSVMVEQRRRLADKIDRAIATAVKAAGKQTERRACSAIRAAQRDFEKRGRTIQSARRDFEKRAFVDRKVESRE